MKWETRKIGLCCDVTSSKRVFLSEYVDSGVPFYRSKEIIECASGQQVSEPLFISTERYSSIMEQFGVPVAGDMLLTSVGTIGISYIVKPSDRFYFKDGNLTWFRNFSSHLDSRFLSYWISSNEGLGILNGITIGSSQKALTISALKNINIPIPPIVTQRRIAEILSAHDDLIENNRKQIKLLEETAQRLYKEWFVDLRFPGWENTPVVDGLPEGWKHSKVSECAQVLRRGISPQYNENSHAIVINQKCIRGSIVDMSESRRQDKPFPNELKLQDGDTVICSTGAGTLGRVGQVLGSYPNATIDSHVTLIRANIRCGKQFLYYALKVCQPYFMGMGKGSTNQLELYRDVIRETKLHLPTQKVIQLFELIAQPICDKMRALTAEIISAQKARDALLPKLMSGEIEV